MLGPELTEHRRTPRRRRTCARRSSSRRPSHPPGYLVVRAVPTSGAEVRGIRVNEDVFWIHIRDASGTVHTLQKSDLARVDRELEATLMPSYESRLSPRAARRSRGLPGDTARCEMRTESGTVAEGCAAASSVASLALSALARAAAAPRTASG